MRAAGGGATFGTEISGGFEAGFRARFHRTAQGICLHGQVLERDHRFRMALVFDKAAFQYKIFHGRFQLFAGHLQNLFFDHLCGGIDGVSCYDHAAAGKGAGAPVEDVGVAGHQVNVLGIDAQMLGHHLHKGGEMPLALGAYACGHIHLARGLHLHPRALIGADAGAFDVCDHANAHMPTFCPEFRLFFFDELFIADHIQSLL